MHLCKLIYKNILHVVLKSLNPLFHLCDIYISSSLKQLQIYLWIGGKFSWRAYSVLVFFLRWY